MFRVQQNMPAIPIHTDQNTAVKSITPAPEDIFFPSYLSEDDVLQKLHSANLIDERNHWCGGKILIPLDMDEKEGILSLIRQTFFVNSQKLKLDIKTSIHEVLVNLYAFCGLNKISLKDCEIVGSYVFYLLGLNYILRCLKAKDISLEKLCSQEWIEELKEKLQTPPSDTDIRFIIPGASIMQLNELRFTLISFLSKKIPQNKQTNKKVKEQIVEILTENFPQRYSKLQVSDKKLFQFAVKEMFFLKLFTTPEENGARYFIASFGNRKNITVELIVEAFLPRKCMFGRNSIRIPFWDFLGKKTQPILPTSDYLDGGQAIVDILADGFSIPNEKNVEPADFFRMLSNYSKGQRCLTYGGEDALTRHFIEVLKNKEDPSEYIWNALCACVDNHHKENVYALVCLVANALRILHPFLLVEDVEKIRKKLGEFFSADSDVSTPKVIDLIHQALVDPLIPLTSIFSLLQAVTFFHMCCPKGEKKELTFSVTKNSGYPFSILKISHLHAKFGLLFLFDPISPLMCLAKEKAFHKLRSLYLCLLPQSCYADFGKAAIQNHLPFLINHESLVNVCTDFRFVEDKIADHFLIHYLFCLNALGYAIDVPLLCSHFLSIVNHSEDRKRLVQNLQALKTFSDAKPQLQLIEECIVDPSKKRELVIEWCSLLFCTSLPSLHTLSLNIWKEILSPNKDIDQKSASINILNMKKINDAIEIGTRLLPHDLAPEVRLEANTCIQRGLVVLEKLSQQNPVVASRFFLLLSQHDLLSKNQQIAFCLKIFKACNNRIELITFLNNALQKIFSNKEKIDENVVTENEIYLLLCFLEEIGDSSLGIGLILWAYPLIKDREKFLDILNRLLPVASKKDLSTCIGYFSLIHSLSIKSLILKQKAQNYLEKGINQHSIPWQALIPALNYVASFELTTEENLRLKQITDLLMKGEKDQGPSSLEEIAAFPVQIQANLSIQLIKQKLGQWSNPTIGKALISLFSDRSVNKLEKGKLHEFLECFVKHLTNPFDKYLLSFSQNQQILSHLLENEKIIVSILFSLQEHTIKYASEIGQLLLSFYNHIYQNENSPKNDHLNKLISQLILSNTSALNQLQKSEQYHANFLTALYSCSLHEEICRWVMSKKLKFTSNMIDLACKSIQALAKQITLKNIEFAENVIAFLEAHMSSHASFKIYEQFVLFFIQKKNKIKTKEYIDKIVFNEPNLLFNSKPTVLDAYYDYISSPIEKIEWLITLFKNKTLPLHWAEKVVELTNSKNQNSIYQLIIRLSLPEQSTQKIQLNFKKTLKQLCHQKDSIESETSLAIINTASRYQISVGLWKLILKKISLESVPLIQKTIDILQSLDKSFSDEDKNMYRQKIFKALLSLSKTDWILLQELVPNFDEFLSCDPEGEELKTLLLNTSAVLQLPFKNKESFLKKIYDLRLRYRVALTNNFNDIEVDKVLVQACCENGSAFSIQGCLTILKLHLKEGNCANHALAEIASTILNSLPISFSSKEDKFMSEFIKIVSPSFSLFLLSDIYSLMQCSILLPKDEAIESLCSLLSLINEKKPKEMVFSSEQRQIIKTVLEYLINTETIKALREAKLFIVLQEINDGFTQKDNAYLRTKYLIKEMKLLSPLNLESWYEIESSYQLWMKDLYIHISEEQRLELLDTYHEMLAERAITLEEISLLITFINNNLSNQVVITILLRKILKRMTSVKQIDQKWNPLFLTILGAIEQLFVTTGYTPDIQYIIKLFAVLIFGTDKRDVANKFQQLMNSKNIMRNHFDLELSINALLDATSYINEKQKREINDDFRKRLPYNLTSDKKIGIICQSIFEIIEILNNCSDPNTRRCLIYFLETYVGELYLDKYKKTIINSFNLLCSEFNEYTYESQLMLLIELSKCMLKIQSESGLAVLELQEILIKSVKNHHASLLKSDMTLETHSQYLNMHKTLLKEGSSIYLHYSATFFQHISDFVSLILRPYNQAGQTFLKNGQVPNNQISVYTISLSKLLLNCQVEKNKQNERDQLIKQWIQNLCDNHYYEHAMSFFLLLKKSMHPENVGMIQDLIPKENLATGHLH